MTNEEAKKMLKAKLECLKNETSGINHDCNMHLCDGCSLNYEQGNMGEQKEALDLAIKALEQTSFEGKTNGEVIKAMFPDVDVKERNNGYEVYFGVGTAIQFFNHQWWNAPYKVESEDKE